MLKKLFFLCCGCLIYSSFAVAAPKYEADVSVDVVADNVAMAKKEAMAKGVRNGLNEVILSISTDEAVSNINTLNDNQIQHFIDGIMVLMEKTSDVRYIADLRISVNEDVLKAYIKENGFPIIISEEKNVLVVPLLEKEDGALDLWSDENIWRNAFIERKNIKKGNLNIVNIDKNLGNIAIVEANRIYDMSDEQYSELASFNKVNDIYVLKYSNKDKKIYIKSYPSKEVNIVEIAEVLPENAIDLVLPYFKNDKKIDNVEITETVVDDVFDVVYTYPQLGKWMQLKRLLENEPQVDEVKVVSMASGKVHFSFRYSGVFEKLQSTLMVNGYNLRDAGGHYVIN